ncbi:acetyl-CoA carboxylase carboxyltransferase subunit alpha [Actinomadura macra]|uniref:acetyl-CoA carboxylase carboxyltransferase subunit alpha n=1 Tax=Actinomadura macra TaxID=46164 RepID=UPI00083291F6|nr:acetyl-CoA carboxylase carboxyltransferase subunit alpha [Actinomadura macra]
MTAVDARGTALAADPEDEKWLRCVQCGASVYVPRLVRNQHVCPECGHHRRLGAHERLDVLVDEGSFRPAEQVRGADPLEFRDSRPYTERLAQARRRTGLEDAMLYGTAAIGGHPVMVAVMDFGFMGGSMGSAVGETVARAAEEAEARRWPLVLAAGSGGARMQEGALSLMQMAKSAQALERLRDAGVPSICVLTDPTFGGVTASFATLADLLVAERGGLIGFAGPRVIEAATRERLPAGFQTAEYLKGQGMLDRVEPRDGVRPLLARLLTLLGGDRKPQAGAPGDAPSGTASGAASGSGGRAARASARSAWDTVKLARDIYRPTTLDYIWQICGDFVELHGDRHFRDDPAVVGGIGDIDGVSVMIIGHQKGHDTKELVTRNFGMPGPEGYRKALRLMRLADSLGLPVVTLVDTQGAAPGVGAEERGQAWAISECIAGMSRLRVPVVATVTGEGGSGGALALAVANTVLMMENACYSVISPESCSTILHGDPSRGAAMAEALRITAPELLELGVVDGVVDEPDGGAQVAPSEAAAALRSAVLSALADLGGLDADELREQRHARFRRQGVVTDA